jgi:hypothetical protein
VAQLTQSLTSLGRIGVAFDGGPTSTSVSPSVADLFHRYLVISGLLS